MNEQELKGFIDVVTNYFTQITSEVAEMGLPYIKDEGTETFDFTGVIGISGARKGGVYLSAQRDMLSEFGHFILGEPLADDEALYDLIGEMTNTITGNMREFFGPSFHISVPIIMKGRIEDIVIRLRPPVFIIPIKWKGYTCHLGVGLE